MSEESNKLGLITDYTDNEINGIKPTVPKGKDVIVLKAWKQCAMCKTKSILCQY